MEIVKALIKEYDIIIEGFRPGVMDRLGLGYEALKEVKPKADLLLDYRLWADWSLRQ